MMTIAESLFFIVQAKITLLESETKKKQRTKQYNQSINQSIFISALDTYRKVIKGWQQVTKKESRAT